MRYVVVSGGLGNQMFQYAFMYSLQKQGNDSCIVPIRILMKDHNGFELSHVFHIPRESISHRMGVISLNCLRAVRHLFKCGSKFDAFFNYKVICQNTNQIQLYNPQLIGDGNNSKTDKILYRGFWQSEKYFEGVKDEIKHIYSFDLKKCSAQTLSVLNLIENSNAVSLHVRRTDYLPIKEFAEVCTLKYYAEAINYIMNHVEKPRFFIFSDDRVWAKENIKIDGAEYIDFNIKKDSWQDMFLMSKCKHNIIANSTFSWWGAYLNSNLDKIVVAPKTWAVGMETDDLVLDSWIRI